MPEVGHRPIIVYILAELIHQAKNIQWVADDMLVEDDIFNYMSALSFCQ